jgi:hypothetical protein
MPKFVIQEHHARTHHFDFRLEKDGVFKSWAVPKGIPEQPGLKPLALGVDRYKDLAGATLQLGQAQRGPVPSKFSLPACRGRSLAFDITNCDPKAAPPPPLPAACLHRARRSHHPRYPV